MVLQKKWQFLQIREGNSLLRVFKWSDWDRGESDWESRRTWLAVAAEWRYMSLHYCIDLKQICQIKKTDLFIYLTKKNSRKMNILYFKLHLQDRGRHSCWTGAESLAEWAAWLTMFRSWPTVRAFLSLGMESSKSLWLVTWRFAALCTDQLTGRSSV